LFTHAAPRVQVVNIEWPGFAVPELPVLAEDRELDEASNNPGQQQVVASRGDLATHRP
jgi:hypothetical protein